MRVRSGIAAAMVSGLLVVAVAACGDEEPPAPAAAASTAAVVAKPDLVMDVDEAIAIPGAKPMPATAVLAGPGFGLRIAEGATATELGQEFVPSLSQLSDRSGVPDGATAPVTAGPGNEFLLVRLCGLDERGAAPPIPGTSEGQSHVRVGDETRRLPMITREAYVLVLAVPTGAPVTLVATDAGRDQSIDLRTGEPGPDAIPDYLRDLPGGRAEWDVIGRFPGDKLATSVDVEAGASLAPYDEVWAKPGHVWLSIRLSLTFRAWGELGGELDGKRSLQVKADGRTVTVDASATPFTLLSSGVPALYTAEVYAKVQVKKGSVRKVSIRLRPAGDLTLSGKPARFRATNGPTETITLR